MSILDARELTAAEREAVADEPRPGVFWTDVVRVDLATQRALEGTEIPLTQESTDELIYFDLLTLGGQDAFEDLAAIWSPSFVTMTNGAPGGAPGKRQQRGGIHSEPLVRLLAFRAWGDRDRKWFEPDRIIMREYGFDELVVERNEAARISTYRARKGSAVAEFSITDNEIWRGPGNGSVMKQAFERLARRLDQLSHRG